MDKATLLQDYEKALTRFEAAMQTPTDNDLLRAGCIQYFEFSFELAWKTIQAYAADAGMLEVGSPKSCLRHAFKMNWIADEGTWLSMLESRNRMAHTYDAERALDIYDQLPTYAKTLRVLVCELRRL
ncbi:MAG: HI0074 family nucleotidyltransferase substrate-binding subunit [bacterium]